MQPNVLTKDNLNWNSCFFSPDRVLCTMHWAGSHIKTHWYILQGWCESNLERTTSCQSPLLSVRQCYTVSVQCFFSSVVGVTGSARPFRWLRNGQTLAVKCTMSAKSEDHQLLHSSNRAKEVSEPHTQMVSKACVNSMSVTENLRSAHCVYKAIITYFVREQTSSRYCLWTLWRKQKAHVWIHGMTCNTRDLGWTLLPVRVFGIN